MTPSDPTAETPALPRGSRVAVSRYGWRVVAVFAFSVFPSILLTCRSDGAEAQASAPIDFRRDIEPILTGKCARCHGADEQESGLRLDDRENLLRGGDHERPSIVPGDVKASFLIHVVTETDADLRMPPEGEPLSKRQVELLRRWIDQGAKMPSAPGAGSPSGSDFWSFRPLRTTPPPAIDDPWIANPIDAFVLAKLREKGLAPSPPAPASVLGRRVHLVMHGLPPTLDQVARGRSHSENAELVEDVLSSPRYGERWAQHWLDVIRWAETAGFETNAPRPNAWPYRDWLIDSLNADKPFDRFVFEQIAGDTVGQDAALGFLVAGPANLPGQIGRDEESMRQARQDELDEVIRTVGQTFLGVTVGCARCHSHKFDPITQRDYYALQAVFVGMRYGERRLRGAKNDRWTAQAADAANRVQALEAEIEAKRAALDLRPPVTDQQEESFDPVEVQAVRMDIAATGDGKQASLYEVEVWTAGDTGAPSENVALARRGGQAIASGFALENQTRHPDNLIDGSVDERQAFPWKADKPGPAWIRIDLAQTASVDRVTWQRGYGTPADYRISVQAPDGIWREVAHSRDRLPRVDDARKPDEVRLDGVSAGDTARLVSLLADLRSARSEHARLSAGPRVFAARFTDPQPTWVLRRGDAMQRGDPVGPAVPAVLGNVGLAPDAPETQRRLALARFLANPENPLTARVIVNRIWQHHFGAGIVDTPSDFGHLGSRPTHPKLLDWLAGELIRSGWSLKHIHRLILQSNTFRQAGAPNQAAFSIDADSRLLWRFPPRRLDAEALRDSILLVSGKLNDAMRGSGFDLFNQRGGLSDYVSKETFDAEGWRRMIYATKIRMQAVDIFGSFDCPDAGQMTPRRSRSITPIQALNLFNSPFVNRQAGFFADRVRAEAGAQIDDQVKQAMRLALGREPSEDELARLRTLGERHGLPQVCRILLNANEFVFLQ